MLLMAAASPETAVADGWMPLMPVRSGSWLLMPTATTAAGRAYDSTWMCWCTKRKEGRAQYVKQKQILVAA